MEYRYGPLLLKISWLPKHVDNPLSRKDYSTKIKPMESAACDRP